MNYIQLVDNIRLVICIKYYTTVTLLSFERGDIHKSKKDGVNHHHIGKCFLHSMAAKLIRNIAITF